MSKAKKVIAVTLVTGGLIVGTSSASQAALPKPLQDIYDATIGRISSTFTNLSNQYIGGLIDEYLPRGFEIVIGELGLPDPGGVFDDIRAKIAAGDNKDVDPRLAESSLSSWGDIQIGNTSAEMSRVLGEGFFSEDSQLANAEGGKAVAQSVEAVNASNQKLQGLDVTQDIWREIGNQNAAMISVQAAFSQQLAQQNQQAAGTNLSLSELAKGQIQQKQEKANQLADKSKAAVGQASFGSGLLEK